MSVDFIEIEKKWRRHWEVSGAHKARLDGVPPEKRQYVLTMFSYPSGDRLHLGHWFNFGPADTFARFKKMQGHTVFEPMGFDAFGLPAENHAIRTGIHPDESTNKNMRAMREQLRNIGAMYDWDHEVVTCRPEYYRWNQWMFLKFFEKGLAYRKEGPVNWCDACQTVLANEQVIDGACERHPDQAVTRKKLTQWYLKITDYAEELLDGLEGLDWPEETKIKQRNWIGKSTGLECEFQIPGKWADGGSGPDLPLKIFTTRPDTMGGATFMVLAPEHDLTPRIVQADRREACGAYIQNAARMSEIDRASSIRETTGQDTGARAINPVTGEEIPIFIADYVLATYGTGAIMAVPAHDERDFAFATKYGLEIRPVIFPENQTLTEPLSEAYTGDGYVKNTPGYDGGHNRDVWRAVAERFEKEGKGTRKINYRMRDWLISRQRYWGTPIPIAHCGACGLVPVPEGELPVVLPEVEEYRPKGVSPLAGNKSFMNVKCPNCGAPAQRDPDTMDTFVDSSWYFLRYLTAKKEDGPFDRDLCEAWLPAHMYIGGAEHSTMHLLYARFFIKALRDCGLIALDEPFQKLRHQGVILGPDGARMSKNRGNVAAPDPYVAKYGSDAFRMGLMFRFSYDKGGPWDDSGIEAIVNYLQRNFRLAELQGERIGDAVEATVQDLSEKGKTLEETLHARVQAIGDCLEQLRFNSGIARLMEIQNEIYRYLGGDPAAEPAEPALLGFTLRTLTLLQAPFAPHLSEEMWERLGGCGGVFDQGWPAPDPSVLDRCLVTIAVQVNGKLRGTFSYPPGMDPDEVLTSAENLESVRRHTEGKTVIKRIHVPRKLINLVVN